MSLSRSESESVSVSDAVLVWFLSASLFPGGTRGAPCFSISGPLSSDSVDDSGPVGTVFSGRGFLLMTPRPSPRAVLVGGFGAAGGGGGDDSDEDLFLLSSSRAPFSALSSSSGACLSHGGVSWRYRVTLARRRK